jgi:dTDP-4-amino-4,6-dideoxygalactose transaminase
VLRVLRSGRYTLGPEVLAFERDFAGYVGTEEAVGVADGTRAITLVLRCLGIGPGDEVITSPFTAIPTIGAIIETGARPVFVDIDLDTFLIDIRQVPKAITRRTRAVLPVHMFGNVVDVRRLKELVPPEIAIIEDAAQAHGSSLGNERAGTLGRAATFSFYPTKNLGGYGDGGAVTTNDPDLAQRLRTMRNHGMVDKDTCVLPGVNSRLDELQAAVLRVKLRHLDAMNASRAAIARRYIEELPDCLQPQRVAPEATPNWHVFQCRFGGDRDRLVADLDAAGIQTNVYYVVPHHLQPGLAMLGYHAGDFPNLERLCREAIALPMYPELEPATQRQVIGAITAAIPAYERRRGAVA